MRGIAEIHADLHHTAAAIEHIATQRRAATTTPEDLVWAALTLANNPATCTSILDARPVLVRNLDKRQLYHAHRGAPRPPDSDYLLITKEMLHAIVEAGPRKPVEPPHPDNVTPINSHPPRIRPPRTWIPR